MAACSISIASIRNNIVLSARVPITARTDCSKLLNGGLPSELKPSMLPVSFSLLCLLTRYEAEIRDEVCCTAHLPAIDT